MTTAKNDVFIGLELRNCYLVGGGVGGIDFWWGESIGGGGLLVSRWGENDQIFGWWQGD